MRNSYPNSAGFTRLELAVVLAGLALLAIVIKPAVATNTSDAHQAACGNNLRQLGAALLGWSGDHGGRFPWREAAASGGTFYSGKAGNAWFEMLSLSNHVSPRVITCPADLSSDPSVRPSSNWPTFYMNRQSSVSYQIGLDIGMRPANAREVLLADRNTRYNQGPVSCSAGVANAYSGRSSSTSAFGWTNGVHETRGNALLTDGSVEFTDTTRLRQLVKSESEAHFLNAR